ncbi:Kelch motif-containing protein [Giardia muris]|uniref:Kelch motif-containing protein n=1 Tax=Giardia muris TaxID=5742 RepID=A0A4Z1SR65_GIAMU|nr:Kelch motif-containing protein [Giardia muris]|eukprot:TNJ27455.1 Kelch motif-containing protein [Giardia muris]
MEAALFSPSMSPHYQVHQILDLTPGDDTLGSTPLDHALGEEIYAVGMSIAAHSVPGSLKASRSLLVRHGDRYFFFGGGVTPSATLTSFQMQDGRLRAETHGLALAPRTHFGGCLLGSSYMMHGGAKTIHSFRCDLHDAMNIDVINLDTLTTERWELGGDYIEPRWGHASCLVDNHTLFIAGGSNGKKKGLRDTFLIDLDRRESRHFGSLPIPLSHMTACSIDGRVYVFGGVSGLSASRTLYSCPLDGGLWQATKLTAIPERYGHVMLRIGRQIIIHGGRNSGGCLSDTWVIDTTKNDCYRLRISFSSSSSSSASNGIIKGRALSLYAPIGTRGFLVVGGVGEVRLQQDVCVINFL